MKKLIIFSLLILLTFGILLAGCGVPEDYEEPGEAGGISPSQNEMDSFGGGSPAPSSDGMGF